MQRHEIYSLVDVYLSALPHGSRRRVLEQYGIEDLSKLKDDVRDKLYAVLFGKA
jgi:hypothetical protein